MDSLDKKVRLISFLDEVWSGGDIEACGKYVGPSYAIHHDPGDPWDGKTLDVEGLKERIRLSREPFPDQRFEVQTILEDGPRVAVAWTWTGTHSASLPGFPATGKRLTMSGSTIYDFDEACLIRGHWQVSDRLGIYQQLQAATSV